MNTKPQVSKIEERANTLYTFLKNGNTYTKKEMCIILGWDVKTHDRQIRDVIALLATVRPIISTSDKRGYKIAETREETQHQINEIQSRITELQKRLTPLNKKLNEL